jgi:hypothetical protein
MKRPHHAAGLVAVSIAAAQPRHPQQDGADVVFSAVGLAAVVEIWGRIKRVFDPYRPELHYMRGPGPKWCEKHPGSSWSKPPHQ